MLKRSIETADSFDEEEYDIKQMRMLNELNAGIAEGMTYDEIRAKWPQEYAQRKADKLRYRYPGAGGESYLDVINRLRAVIVEVERMQDHVLLVAHRVVARGDPLFPFNSFITNGVSTPCVLFGLAKRRRCVSGCAAWDFVYAGAGK